MSNPRLSRNLGPLALLATSALALACSSSSVRGGDTEVKSDKIRVTSPAVQMGDMATLGADNRHFAWDLYQAVRAESTDNLVFSPFSISIALAMTYGGARGGTADQMAATLRFSLPAERLHSTFDALDLALEAPPMGDGFQLSLANALWGERSLTFQPDFLDLLAVNYGASMHTLDFRTSPDAARMTINQWVSDRTQAKIQDLLPPQSIDASTVFVLTNAVYFKAKWHAPFEANSPNGTFNAPSGPVQVPMMQNGVGASFGGWVGAGYHAVTLPYKGMTSMVLIVPDAGTFDTFEASTTAADLEAILSPTASSSYVLSMPRFKIGTALALKSTLSKMGMTDAFMEGAADFSGIDGARDISLTAVVHNAVISVDENGTEAAAATGVVGGNTGAPPQQLVVDRPFIYAVRDDDTGTILFLGRVLDPSK